jgi:hypothetical protein
MKYFDCVNDYRKRGELVKDLKKEYKDKTKEYYYLVNARANESDIAKVRKEVKFIERQLKDLSRKNMHQHIALSLFRGTPLNKILSENTRKRIRPESVWNFLTEITEW